MFCRFNFLCLNTIKMKEQKCYCDKIIKIEMLSYIEGATKL